MRTILWSVVVVMALALLAGCARPPERVSDGQGAPDKVAETPAPTATPRNQAQGAPKEDQPKESSPTDSEPKLPELKYVGREVTLTWEQSGRPKMRAVAKELTGDTVAGKAYLKRVNADLYENGVLVATLNAPLVEADEKTRVVTATGGVKLVSKTQGSSIRSIRAEWIKWYSGENKVVGNGGVTAQGPVASVQAAAFTADTRLKTVRILADPAEARAVVGNRE